MIDSVAVVGSARDGCRVFIIAYHSLPVKLFLFLWCFGRDFKQKVVTSQDKTYTMDNLSIISPLELYLICGIALLAIVQIIYTFRYKLGLRNSVRDNALSEGDEICTTSVSVIVYADRANAHLLSQSIPSIMMQNYPDFEVVVVNADSSSAVEEAITLLTVEYPKLKSTFIPDTNCHISIRKLAVMLGVKAAKSEVVLLTDANCLPDTGNWIRAMVRHIDSATGIVIGYSAIDREGDSGFGHRYRAFDRTVDACHYLFAATKGRVVRGNRCNIAYRRSLFFANKGFSRTMNLKYGDDDIFIQEIANYAGVTAEFTADGLVTEKGDGYAHSFDYEKAHRYFTHSQMDKSPVGIETVMYLVRWVFLALVGGAVAWSVFSFIAGNYINAGVLAGAAVALYLTDTLIYIFAHRKMSRILNSPLLFMSLPVFRTFRPIINLRYRTQSKRVDNYTWQ